MHMHVKCHDDVDVLLCSSTPALNIVCACRGKSLSALEDGSGVLHLKGLSRLRCADIDHFVAVTGNERTLCRIIEVSSICVHFLL